MYTPELVHDLVENLRVLRVTKNSISIIIWTTASMSPPYCSNSHYTTAVWNAIQTVILQTPERTCGFCVPYKPAAQVFCAGGGRGRAA
jgi:hypothetical protein